MTYSTNDIDQLLSRRIGLADIDIINRWAACDAQNLKYLFDLAHTSGSTKGVNALRCLTHLNASHSSWLQSLQNEFIDLLLVEEHTGKRRMLLSILRKQSYSPATIRTDFLDFCFSKINSECEPYAIRCFSLYCAFNMCKFYPELLSELNEYVKMLDQQNLSPGLASALRKTRKNIKKYLREG